MEINTQQNNLKQSSSPYLQQHAHNPVHWQEWTPEILKHAKQVNKPLIVSIGYAACHWCHVMEHESFMDSGVAEIMNRDFVCVKVDREERPDVDQVYMNAIHLMGGRGGWPLNAFALPDGRPFYAGTYFPKAQWINLLEQITEVHQKTPDKVEEQANALTRGIRAQEIVKSPDDNSQALTRGGYSTAAKSYANLFDEEWGGLQGAPKFPLPVGWEFLLQHYYLTGEEKSLKMVVKTLYEMGKGGIYDQIGGGFARYSVDAEWKVPHFEKMLYDNAQLVSLYAHAYKITHDPFFSSIIRQTLEFVSRELTDKKGGFYSSLNADSEGEEGKFYVWTYDEVARLLPEEYLPAIEDYYLITKEGNWEKGVNILHVRSAEKEICKKHNLSPEAWNKMLKSSREVLLKERTKRERPSTDDKILTAWNALMLKAYIDAWQALGGTSYLETAIKNAHFLEAEMINKDGSLRRNFKDGKASIPAFLDDYTLLSEAFIGLYQATFDFHWLKLAKSLVDFTLAHFADENSPMFYYTQAETNQLIARNMELGDNVIPGSNSVMAKVLFQLGEYFNQEAYHARSKQMLSLVSGQIEQHGPYYANWGLLAGWILDGGTEIAIAGKEAQSLSAELQRHFLPTSLLAGGTEANVPLLQNRYVEHKNLIYVCRNKTCELPVEEVQQALDQIRK